MVGRTSSSTLIGIDAVRVDIETQIISALKRFALVGLPDGILREAKDRVRCAVENSGFYFPVNELVVNLSPAGLPKSGSGFDLAIALSILAATGVIDPERLTRVLILGELALDGSVRGVPSIFAAACLVKNLPGYELLLPKESVADIEIIPNVAARAVTSLAEAVLHFAGKNPLPLVPTGINAAEHYVPPHGFGDVVGQHKAKRAIEIVAAGGHNLLMVGPPGAGKSMLAARIPSILPPLAIEEQIEVSKIYSAHAYAGEVVRTGVYPSLVARRPFRAPHYSLSTPGLVGGGPNPSPGEISLAHRGVLFLDEVTEIRREAIEALRQPLETRRVTISRAKLRVQFPADFVLVAAMNPCPCGRKGTSGIVCRCPSGAVTRYWSRLSGPIRDRIDLQIWVPPVAVRDLQKGEAKDPTPEMRERVALARLRQAERVKGGFRLNARLRPAEVRAFCGLDRDGSKMLEEAAEKYHLTARGYNRVLKVARTVADLDQSPEIRLSHVSEALSYRVESEN